MEENKLEETKNDRIYLEAAWEPEGEDELSASLFRHSPDTVKKGEPYDLLILFCALFAIGCMCVMLYSGINNGFTPSMYVLIACYVVIAFCCLCKPLHFALSKAVWKTGFIEKFPIKRCSDTRIALDDKKLYYTDAAGNEISHSYDKMTGIYETRHYLVFHEDDKNIFAVNKSRLADSELMKRVYALIGADQNTESDNDLPEETSEKTGDEENVSKDEAASEETGDEENASKDEAVSEENGDEGNVSKDEAVSEENGDEGNVSKDETVSGENGDEVKFSKVEGDSENNDAEGNTTDEEGEKALDVTGSENSGSSETSAENETSENNDDKSGN